MNKHQKLTQYLTGFVLSVALTVTAYALVVGDIMEGMTLLYAISGLALVQALVQLLFFLHLRDEAEPRWKLLVFDLMLMIVAIVVFGSLWIMNNLNYNMMTPQQTDTYMLEEEGIRR